MATAHDQRSLEGLAGQGASERLAVTLIRSWPRALVLAIGEVDAFNVRVLERRLEEALELRARSVIVDVSQLSFVGGPALRTFAGTAAELRRRGGDLVLVDPSAGLMHLLELVGMADSLTIARLKVGGGGQPAATPWPYVGPQGGKPGPGLQTHGHAVRC